MRARVCVCYLGVYLSMFVYLIHTQIYIYIIHTHIYIYISCTLTFISYTYILNEVNPLVLRVLPPRAIDHFTKSLA